MIWIFLGYDSAGYKQYVQELPPVFVGRKLNIYTLTCREVSQSSVAHAY